MKKIIMDYCFLHQINKFGPIFFDFHAWVIKCHFGNFSEFSKIAKNGIFFYSLLYSNCDKKNPSADAWYLVFSHQLIQQNKH